MKKRTWVAVSLAALAIGLSLPSACIATTGTPPTARSAALRSLEARSQTPATISLNPTTGAIEWVSGRYAAPVPGDPVASSFRFLEQNSAAFALAEPRRTFKLLASEGDDLLKGWRDVYLKQSVNGLEVYGETLCFHYNAEGQLVAVSGSYAPDQTTSTKATLSVSEAKAAARRAVVLLAGLDDGDGLLTGVEALAPSSLSATASPKLVFYSDQVGTLHLSYLINVSDGFLTSWNTFIDAKSGAVLSRESKVKTAGSGINLFGRKVGLQTTRINGRYQLVDRSLPMYRKHTNHPYTKNDGTIEIRDALHNKKTLTSNKVVSDPNGDNFFNHGGSDPKENQQSAVSLAQNKRTSYLSFQKQLKRNSIDNKGLAIIGNVHQGRLYQNAYWTDTYKMTFFGDNAVGEEPFAKALDIVAHELGHGITQFSVPKNILYANASGSINETYSDIWASMVDYDDWGIGEDLGKALRVLDAPELGDPPLPKTMSDYISLVLPLDNGGVHYNCSIGCASFAYLSKRLPATPPAKDGRFTASRIFYRSYRYVTHTVTHRQLAYALRQSAIDLYGKNSIQEQYLLQSLGYTQMDTLDFGIYDNGYCLDDRGILQWYLGYPGRSHYVAVRCTTPEGAKLASVDIALNPQFFPTGKALELYILPPANDGGPSMDANRSFASEDIRANQVPKSTGVFATIPMREHGGVAVPREFYILVGYTEDRFASPSILCDSGNTPTGRSWSCKYNEAIGGWERQQLVAQQDGTNFLIRPMFTFAGGITRAKATSATPAATAPGVPIPQL